MVGEWNQELHGYPFCSKYSEIYSSFQHGVTLPKKHVQSQLQQYQLSPLWEPEKAMQLVAISRPLFGEICALILNETYLLKKFIL
jgi:hypothetical protein